MCVYVHRHMYGCVWVVGGGVCMRVRVFMCLRRYILIVIKYRSSLFLG